MNRHSKRYGYKSVFLFFLLIFGPMSANKVSANNSHLIVMDLSGLPIGGFELQYQYSLGSYLSLVVPVQGQMLKFNSLPSELITSFKTFLGFGFLPDVECSSGLGLNFALEGFYLEPLVWLGYARVDYPSRFGQRHLMVFRPSLSLGYQKVLPIGLFTSLGIGLSKRFFLPSEAVSKLQPHLSVRVGYAW